MVSANTAASRRQMAELLVLVSDEMVLPMLATIC